MSAPKANWMDRAAEHRKAAVLEVENRPDGETIEKACRRVAAKYNGRSLPGGKHLNMSKDSLKRFYNRWQREESDSVFDFNYVPNCLSVIRPWIGHLLAEYAIAHGLNTAQAYRRLKTIDPDLPFSDYTMRRHITATDHKRIKKAVQLRKRKKDIDQEINTLTQGVKQ